MFVVEGEIAQFLFRFTVYLLFVVGGEAAILLLRFHRVPPACGGGRDCKIFICLDFTGNRLFVVEGEIAIFLFRFHRVPPVCGGALHISRGEVHQVQKCKFKLGIMQNKII